ncbi:MAG: TRAP transporter small permease [Maritimibacter sp.]|nr:TRAP transporter small permease [Maritimibacter sp.]
MYHFFLSLSRLMAILGGFVLSLIVVLVVLSVIGRELNSMLHGDLFGGSGFAAWALGVELPGIWGKIKLGPVNGDYELVEAGIAFSIFAFLPLAQITGAHATVDIFTSWMSDPAQKILTTLIDIAFAVVLVLIALQLFHGTVDKFERHQTTLLLQFPVWWAYTVSLVGAIMAVVVSAYLALVRLAELVTGRRLVPHGEGADH